MTIYIYKIRLRFLIYRARFLGGDGLVFLFFWVFEYNALRFLITKSCFFMTNKGFLAYFPLVKTHNRCVKRFYILTIDELYINII